MVEQFISRRSVHTEETIVMPKNRNLEKYICSKFLEMMDKTPFYRMKVLEFSKYAKIGRSTFYTCFDSMAAVAQRIEDQLLDGLEETFDLMDSESYADDRNACCEAIVDTSCRYVHGNRYAFKVLLGKNGDPYFHIRLRKMSVEVTKRFCKTIVQQSDQRKFDFYVDFLVGGQIAVLMWATRNKISVEEMIELSKGIFLNVLNDLESG